MAGSGDVAVDGSLKWARLEQPVVRRVSDARRRKE
jgi:hypothetical protein